jgi:hypothetical protein
MIHAFLVFASLIFFDSNRRQSGLEIYPTHFSFTLHRKTSINGGIPQRLFAITPQYSNNIISKPIVTISLCHLFFHLENRWVVKLPNPRNRASARLRHRVCCTPCKNSTRCLGSDIMTSFVIGNSGHIAINTSQNLPFVFPTTDCPHAPISGTSPIPQLGDLALKT